MAYLCGNAIISILVSLSSGMWCTNNLLIMFTLLNFEGEEFLVKIAVVEAMLWSSLAFEKGFYHN